MAAGSARFMIHLSLVLVTLTAGIAGPVVTPAAASTADLPYGMTTRVSVDSAGGQANHASGSTSSSRDGRYVAFQSAASNLVTSDTNSSMDVFIHDRQTGQTSRVSVDSTGTQANGNNVDPSISADGRFVAFISYASNLVSEDTNVAPDVFVHDRETGVTSRVSVDSSGAQANGWTAYPPSISGDGRFVAFSSSASNLVSGDTNGATDVFLHDRHASQTTRLSVRPTGVQGNNPSVSPSISGDGNHIAFTSGAWNLVDGDTNGGEDVFVHDRQTGEISRVSVDSADNQTGTHSHASVPTISWDGRYVAFTSNASNLVAGDTNGFWDVFVRDRQLGQTSRVSVGPGGAQANNASHRPSVSEDGRYVAFDSSASNLVTSDTNDTSDVFVYEVTTGQTTRMSVDSTGLEANGSGTSPSISGDGRLVAFHSTATNLIAEDTNKSADVFVRDRVASISVAGVSAGAAYEFGTVPAAGCEVRHATDGELAFAATLSALSGSRAADGLGSQTATCSYTDTSGVTITASATYAIVDTTAPALSLPADQTVEATDSTGAAVDYGTPLATDAVDGPVAVSCSPASGATFPLGSTQVTCSATDGAGNTATGSFTVTVIDTSAPVLTLPANATLAATGSSGAVHNYDVTATDAVDGPVAVSCSHAAGTTFPLGTTTVNCSAADARDNPTTGSFTVTVQDEGAPIVTVPAPLTLEATGPDGAVATYTATATDDVEGTLPTTCTPASGSTFPLGPSTVTCSATDTAGNTGTGTIAVTVQDTTPPALTVPPSPVVVEARSNLGATVTFDVSATDIVSGAITPHCDRASGETFMLGTHTVSCAATDDAGRTSTATFNVTVQDTTRPDLPRPPDLTVEATGPDGAAVAYPAVIGTDTVAGTVTAVCTPDSGSVFPLELTTVTCTATDGAGNSSTTSFTVTVLDTTPPALTVPANQVAAATGPNGASVFYPAATATDVVGVAHLTCTPDSGSVFPVGVTTVTCTATDTVGLTTTATFTVTVNGDVTKPVVSVPADVTVEATSSAGATVAYPVATATDDVDGTLTPTCTPTSGSVFPIGPTPVSCSATDAAGNTGSNAFTVTVVDTTAPEITVPANIDVAATSSAGATVTYDPATAADLVDGTVPVTCDHASATVFALGTTTVTCTATDTIGNAAAKSFTVTVTYDLDTTTAMAGLTRNDGSFAVFRVNQTVPLRFQLNGDSAAAGDLVARLYLSQVSDGVPGTETEAASTGLGGDAGNTFSYDPTTGEYGFNLGTRGMNPGTWQARLDLGDGVLHTVQFGLRK